MVDAPASPAPRAPGPILLGDSGVALSPLVFGGWSAGKADWVGIDDRESIAAHRAAFEHGITAFDTAEEYGEGHGERILAEALGAHRREIVIATKVSWRHLRPEQVIRACEGSLARLRTDVIDLYQVHWPAGSFGSEVVPLEDTLGALDTLRLQGKIRAIGLSNASRAELLAARRVTRIDAVQPCYSLFFRAFEDDLLATCQECGVAVMAYSPLAQGLLTGRFGPGITFPAGDNRAENKLFQGETFAEAQRVLAALRPFASKYGTSLGGLALAWLRSHPGVAPVVGARTASQAVENAAAVAVTLAPEDAQRIGDLGRRVADRHRGETVLWRW